MAGGNMKLTNETLRVLYLKDLELPDKHHGRTTPKVKYFKQWKDIQPFHAHGNPIAIDVSRDPDIWVWSDQHIGHKNIIDYTGRPYPNVKLMNDCLIGNYQKVVKPNDIVIWGGDVALVKNSEINAILATLPGYKIHIVGNHDMDRSGKVKNLAMDERYLCYVVDVLDHDMEFQLLFTHYPMDNVPKNCVNVHGHIHQNVANAWNINVSVEHTNYAPINLKDIIKRARTYLENHK
jgi:calcineurin-like phosphoesterase family protein